MGGLVGAGPPRGRVPGRRLGNGYGHFFWEMPQMAQFGGGSPGGPAPSWVGGGLKKEAWSVCPNAGTLIGARSKNKFPVIVGHSISWEGEAFWATFWALQKPCLHQAGSSRSEAGQYFLRKAWGPKKEKQLGFLGCRRSTTPGNGRKKRGGNVVGCLPPRS